MKLGRLFLVLAAMMLLASPLLAQGTGSHYNLNLLGKENCPGDDLVGTNRHTIMVLLNFSDIKEPNSVRGDLDVLFADLDKRNKIFLSPGEDFQVTDGNACDKDGAALTLPDDIVTNWDIWVRELGKPGGTGEITTCAVDPGTQEVVCSMYSVELERRKGTPVWQNVTTKLTTITYTDYIGGAQHTVNLFDAPFYKYFWDYDNNGLRLVQLRFYPHVVE